MAHEIYFRNGRADMAYIGDTPWHGLGQELRVGATIDEWNEAAGFDFALAKTPVRYNVDHDGNTFKLKMPGQNVLYRTDNGKPMSVVSDQ